MMKLICQSSKRTCLTHPHLWLQKWILPLQLGKEVHLKILLSIVQHHLIALAPTAVHLSRLLQALRQKNSGAVAAGRGGSGYQRRQQLAPWLTVAPGAKSAAPSTEPFFFSARLDLVVHRQLLKNEANDLTKARKLMLTLKKICDACNSGDEDAVRVLVEEVYDENCAIFCNDIEQVGRSFILAHYVESMRVHMDAVRTYQNFRFLDRYIKFEFVFNTSKDRNDSIILAEAPCLRGLDLKDMASGVAGGGLMPTGTRRQEADLTCIVDGKGFIGSTTSSSSCSPPRSSSSFLGSSGVRDHFQGCTTLTLRLNATLDRVVRQDVGSFQYVIDSQPK